jgi:hypothetical protein
MYALKWANSTAKANSRYDCVFWCRGPSGAEVEVILRPTVGWPVYLGVGHPSVRCSCPDIIYTYIYSMKAFSDIQEYRSRKVVIADIIRLRHLLASYIAMQCCSVQGFPTDLH